MAWVGGAGCMDPNPTRLEAYRYVKDHPGCAVADVARQLNVDHSTATYHLRRLAREDRITTEMAGRVRGHVVNGAGFCPYLTRVLPRLRTPEARAVLEALATRDHAGVVELASEHGMDRSSVRWALQVLQDVGLVERVGRGTYQVPRDRRVCAARAAASRGCSRWGLCAVSRGWEGEGEEALDGRRT